MTAIGSLPALVIAVTAILPAIAVRHDRTSADIERRAKDFPAVGVVSGMGTGTLIGDRWVLTAAHVPEILQKMRKTGLTFEIAGRTYVVANVHVPKQREPISPGEPSIDGDNAHDIGLLELSEPVTGMAPLEIYTLTDELEKEFVFVGCGGFWKDARQGGTAQQTMRLPRGTCRAGTNRFDTAALNGNQLRATFDAPKSENATEVEVGLLGGDSGGPMLIQVDGSWKVAGVASLLDSGDDELIGNYGDVLLATRVSRYADWIRDTMSSN